MNPRYEYVRKELERRGKWRQLSKVAKDTGVSRRTIGYIMDLKDGRDIRTGTLDTLYDYLKANVKRRDL